MCTRIMTKYLQQIKKIGVRESSLRFRVNLPRVSKCRIHLTGLVPFGRGTSSKFVARSLIMKRHGLRFNGWLMNTGRSSSNLIWRREWDGGRTRGKGRWGGRKEGTNSKEVPLWKQVCDCWENSASTFSTLPEHELIDLDIHTYCRSSVDRFPFLSLYRPSKTIDSLRSGAR